MVVGLLATAGAVAPAPSQARLWGGSPVHTYLGCKEAKRVARHGGICFRIRHSCCTVILRRRGCNYQVSEFRVGPHHWYRLWRVC